LAALLPVGGAGRSGTHWATSARSPRRQPRRTWPTQAGANCAHVGGGGGGGNGEERASAKPRASKPAQLSSAQLSSAQRSAAEEARARARTTSRILAAGDGELCFVCGS